jgi:hypothetical protein
VRRLLSDIWVGDVDTLAKGMNDILGRLVRDSAKRLLFRMAYNLKHCLFLEFSI